MTQLDLPPVSIARYFDLLKRRRWQVVPISVFGLVIGALVAFFIPRYYVAETLLSFQGGTVLKTGEGEDPMAPLVDAAIVTIPFTVDATLEALGWWETADEDGRREQAADVRSRVFVEDISPVRKRRNHALLRIEYKDTDGERAMQLANRLRIVWVDSQRAELVAKANAEFSDLNTEISRVARQLRDIDKQIATFQALHRIDPSDAPTRDSEGRVKPLEEWREERRAIKDLENERTDLEEELNQKNAEIGVQPPTHTVTLDAQELPPAIQDKITTLKLQALQAQAKVEVFATGSRKERYALQHLAKIEAELEEVLAPFGGGGGTKTVPNEAYTSLRAEIRELERKLRANNRKLDLARGRFEGLDKKARERPDVFRDYNDLLRQQEYLTEKLLDRERERTERAKRRQQLNYNNPFQSRKNAIVPPTPTDPNITLVALAGSAVGLALAIGLILLMDVLQSTFKTVDDVERILPLPVLGGLSYMISAEARKRVNRRRARAGVAAGVFLALMISLIIFYYVNPTRLPPVVRDALDVILGATAEPVTPK